MNHVERVPSAMSYMVDIVNKNPVAFGIFVQKTLFAEYDLRHRADGPSAAERVVEDATMYEQPSFNSMEKLNNLLLATYNPCWTDEMLMTLLLAVRVDINAAYDRFSSFERSYAASTPSSTTPTDEAVMLQQPTSESALFDVDQLLDLKTSRRGLGEAFAWLPRGAANDAHPLLVLTCSTCETRAGIAETTHLGDNDAIRTFRNAGWKLGKKTKKDGYKTATCPNCQSGKAAQQDDEDSEVAQFVRIVNTYWQGFGRFVLRLLADKGQSQETLAQTFEQNGVHPGSQKGMHQLLEKGTYPWTEDAIYALCMHFEMEIPDLVASAREMQATTAPTSGDSDMDMSTQAPSSPASTEQEKTTQEPMTEAAALAELAAYAEQNRKDFAALVKEGLLHFEMTQTRLIPLFEKKGMNRSTPNNLLSGKSFWDEQRVDCVLKTMRLSAVQMLAIVHKEETFQTVTVMTKRYKTEPDDVEDTPTPPEEAAEPSADTSSPEDEEVDTPADEPSTDTTAPVEEETTLPVPTDVVEEPALSKPDMLELLCTFANEDLRRFVNILHDLFRTHGKTTQGFITTCTTEGWGNRAKLLTTAHALWTSNDMESLYLFLEMALPALFRHMQSKGLELVASAPEESAETDTSSPENVEEPADDTSADTTAPVEEETTSPEPTDVVEEPASVVSEPMTTVEEPVQEEAPDTTDTPVDTIAPAVVTPDVPVVTDPVAGHMRSAVDGMMGELGDNEAPEKLAELIKALDIPMPDLRDIVAQGLDNLPPDKARDKLALAMSILMSH